MQDATVTGAPTGLTIEDAKGGTTRCYANQVDVSWTAFDIQLHFNEFFDDIREVPLKSNYRVEKKAMVTLSWVEAKQLLGILGKVIAGYEKNNKQIPTVDDFKTFVVK